MSWYQKVDGSAPGRDFLHAIMTICCLSQCMCTKAQALCQNHLPLCKQQWNIRGHFPAVILAMPHSSVAPSVGELLLGLAILSSFHIYIFCECVSLSSDPRPGTNLPWVGASSTAPPRPIHLCLIQCRVLEAKDTGFGPVWSLGQPGWSHCFPFRRHSQHHPLGWACTCTAQGCLDLLLSFYLPF